VDERVCVELWVSLASLLRSYTAAHGLNKDRQATVELGEERITVRHGDQWLDLKREGVKVSWQREDGRSGVLELTEAGRLRANDPCSQDLDQGYPARDGEHPAEEEMDLMAEAWARELML
jgi:hypothetical protein